MTLHNALSGKGEMSGIKESGRNNPAANLFPFHLRFLLLIHIERDIKPQFFMIQLLTISTLKRNVPVYVPGSA